MRDCSLPLAYFDIFQKCCLCLYMQVTNMHAFANNKLNKLAGV
jgi:hypothetical protein